MPVKSRRSVLGLVGLTLVTASCTRGHVAAPSTDLPSVGAQQVVAYTSGRAEVVVGERRFAFALEPSRLYPSPPALLVLAFGDPATGAGLDIQASPRVGITPTSEEEILTLTLPLGGGVEAMESMDAECSIELDRVDPGGVWGSFTCANLHPATGPGPGIAASGTFSASVAGSPSSLASTPSGPSPTPSTPTGPSPAPPSPSESMPSSGTARAAVEGPVHGRFTLSLRPPAIFVGRGGMQLFYGDRNGTRLGLGGTAFTGSRPTSTRLTLALSLMGGTGPDVASSAGECTVSIRRTSPAAVRGTFSCPRLDTPQGAIRLSGTFDASGLSPGG
jgi:hypothetical protein